jgi:hypothetical protein
MFAQPLLGKPPGWRGFCSAYYGRNPAILAAQGISLCGLFFTRISKDITQKVTQAMETGFNKYLK